MKLLHPYIIRYYHDAQWWHLTIDAYDWEDAEKRINKLNLAQIDGQKLMTVPGWVPFPRLVARVIARLKGWELQ